MKIGKYILEIYTAESIDDVYVSFETVNPFMPISKGDFIDPGAFDGKRRPSDILRVTGIEHYLWTSIDGEVRHKVCVYTEEIKGTREVRTNKSER